MEFAEDARRSDDETFIVRFSAWEGPIEAMLDLARSQKIDLSRIDILELVAQFERVLVQAMALRLELAADWLVMASWLAYLKSRILVRRPKEAKEEADEDVLAFHLKRLDAVKTAADALPRRTQLGRDWFAPGGANAGFTPGSRLAVGFGELLAAYPKPICVAPEPAARSLKPFDLVSVDAAIARLGAEMPEDRWTPLLELVPPSSGLRLRSNIATSLIASLELTRNGTADIRQDSFEDPIYVKRAPAHGR